MAILGIDEVGRGPLAGPLVVGAVILPDDDKEWYGGLKDSKKLSAKKREVLSEIILAEAAVGLGWVSNVELDKVGIANALKIATRRAVKAVQRLHVPFSQIRGTCWSIPHSPRQPQPSGSPSCHRCPPRA